MATDMDKLAVVLWMLFTLIGIWVACARLKSIRDFLYSYGISTRHQRGSSETPAAGPPSTDDDSQVRTLIQALEKKS